MKGLIASSYYISINSSQSQEKLLLLLQAATFTLVVYFPIWLCNRSIYWNDPRNHSSLSLALVHAAPCGHECDEATQRAVIVYRSISSSTRLICEHFTPIKPNKDSNNKGVDDPTCDATIAQLCTIPRIFSLSLCTILLLMMRKYTTCLRNVQCCANMQHVIKHTCRYVQYFHTLCPSCRVETDIEANME